MAVVAGHASIGEPPVLRTAIVPYISPGVAIGVALAAGFVLWWVMRRA